MTHGNSDTFGINWSENFRTHPVSQLASRGQQPVSSVWIERCGEKRVSFAEPSFVLHDGGLQHGRLLYNGRRSLADSAGGVRRADSETHTDSSAYGFNITHRLPLEGSFSAGINRSDWNTEYLGTSTTGTVDLINALASMHPSSKLSLSASANYSDNLNGQLVESVARSRRRGTGDQLEPGFKFSRPVGSCQLQSRIESANLSLCRTPHPILSGRELRSEFLRWERHIFT